MSIWGCVGQGGVFFISDISDMVKLLKKKKKKRRTKSKFLGTRDKGPRRNKVQHMLLKGMHLYRGER